MVKAWFLVHGWSSPPALWCGKEWGAGWGEGGEEEGTKLPFLEENQSCPPDLDISQRPHLPRGSPMVVRLPRRLLEGRKLTFASQQEDTDGNICLVRIRVRTTAQMSGNSAWLLLRYNFYLHDIICIRQGSPGNNYTYVCVFTYTHTTHTQT